MDSHTSKASMTVARAHQIKTRYPSQLLPISKAHVCAAETLFLTPERAYNCQQFLLKRGKKQPSENYSQAYCYAHLILSAWLTAPHLNDYFYSKLLVYFLGNCCQLLNHVNRSESQKTYHWSRKFTSALVTMTRS